MTITISPKPPRIPNNNIQTGLIVTFIGTYMYLMKQYEDNYHKRTPTQIYYERNYINNKYLYFDSMLNYWKYGIFGN